MIAKRLHTVQKSKAIFVVLLLICSISAYAQKPQLYLINANKAATIKIAVHQNEDAIKNLNTLKRQADKILLEKFGSVMDKKFVPPCGNMHEYMSMARYYWPDPNSTHGKPYIKKDGEKNPDNDLVTDDKYFDKLVASVHMLSWAYYLTNEEKYADKSIGLLRMWFLDTATRMEPNLNHAQIRTGIDTGVSTGIIDTHNLPEILDAVGLLRSSKSWKSADENGIKQWFASYLQWLLTSPNGKKEGEAKNNHGTFYEVQIATMAMFCDRQDVAKQVFKKAVDRLTNQIEPDGKQPLELSRTLSLGYSTFNVEAWSKLADAAEIAGVDLWHYQTDDGRSIKKAIDYLMPYATGISPWPYQQIRTYKPQEFYRLLLVAADKYKDDNYKKQAEKIKDSNKSVLIKLLYE